MICPPKVFCLTFGGHFTKGQPLFYFNNVNQYSTFNFIPEGNTHDTG